MKKSITVNLEQSTIEKVDKEAQKQDRSRSQMIDILLNKILI